MLIISFQVFGSGRTSMPKRSDRNPMMPPPPRHVFPPMCACLVVDWEHCTKCIARCRKVVNVSCSLDLFRHYLYSCAACCAVVLRCAYLSRAGLTIKCYDTVRLCVRAVCL